MLPQSHFIPTWPHKRWQCSQTGMIIQKDVFILFITLCTVYGIILYVLNIFINGLTQYISSLCKLTVFTTHVLWHFDTCRSTSLYLSSLLWREISVVAHFTLTNKPVINILVNIPSGTHVIVSLVYIHKTRMMSVGFWEDSNR